MSASREKKNRQERAAQGVDPRAERLAKEAAEQKKNRLVYGGIAVLFVIVAVVVLLVVILLVHHRRKKEAVKSETPAVSENT